MQTCVSTYSLSALRRRERLTLPGLIDRVATLADQAGLDVRGVEIAAAPEVEADDHAAALTAARKAHQRAHRLRLAVPSYNMGAELLVPERQQRGEVARIQRGVDVAAALGAGVMRFDVSRGFEGKHARWWDRPRTITQLVKHVVPAIREVADYAAQRSITVTVENHGFYLQTVDRITRLLDAVDHENYGLTLDLGNWLCLDQDPVDAAKQLAPRATIVHAKDFHRWPAKQAPPGDPAGGGWLTTPKGTALRGAVLGHGDIDVRAQFKALRRAGYAGWVSLEFEGIEHPDTGVRLGLAALEAFCD